MTQKANLFKGQQKKKPVPSRHGKAPQIRKGKRAVKPSKNTKQMDVDRDRRTDWSGESTRMECSTICSSFRFYLCFLSDLLGISSHVLFRYLAQELTKFINQCNETKAATFATKDGGQLCILKKPESSSKKPESSSVAAKK